MGLLLTVAGALFALLYVLYAFIQTLRGSTRIGFRGLLLAFLAALLPLAGLVAGSQSAAPHPLLTVGTQGVGAALAVVSLLVLLLELRRPEKLKGSRGGLGAGIGLLVLVASVTVPMTAANLLAPALATATPIRLTSVASAQSSGGTLLPTLTATPFPTFTPTLTRTLRPQATATATRFAFATRTPPPTVTAPTPCMALALYNVNVRAKPDTGADLIVTVPFDSSLMLVGRTTDSSWWYGSVGDQEGWVKGEYLRLSAACSSLPERSSR